MYLTQKFQPERILTKQSLARLYYDRSSSLKPTALRVVIHVEVY